jgi:hypothetical protein
MPWRGVECGGLRPALVVLPLLLAGCASTAIQENQAATSAFALREVGVEAQLQSTDDARAAAATNARTLLAEPLTADGAVQIAVGYSPTFQRMLADSAAASAAGWRPATSPRSIGPSPSPCSISSYCHSAAASPTCSRRSIDCAVQGM